MAVDKRDKIFPEDALPVAYECRVIDVDSGNSYGEPAEPIEAYARILDKTTGEFMLLSSDIYGPVEIVPKTSTTGAILKYTVTSDFTVVPGDYTIFITAVYADGTITTEDRDFKVLDFS